MVKTLLVKGKKLDTSEYLHYGTNEFKVIKVIQIQSKKVSEQALTIKDNTSLLLVFSDETQWIVSGHDIHEILNIESKNLTIKYIIQLKSQRESWVDSAEEFDIKRMNQPGLFLLDEMGNLNKTATLEKGKYLLFLHGVASCTYASFGDLLFAENEEHHFSQLHAQYGDCILTYEHRTISKSPFENAIKLLSLLPDHCQLDIISHSSGGLIAEYLVAADCRISNNKIGSNALSHFKDLDNASKLIQQFNFLVTHKRITVEKVVHVGSPLMGSFLLNTHRPDHFLNMVLKGSQISSKYLNTNYSNALKTLIFKGIHTRQKLEYLPGISALMPGNIFQKTFTISDLIAPGKQYVIESHTEKLGIKWTTVSKILTHLGYWQSNDLITNIGSMRGGIQRSEKYEFLRIQGEGICHFTYFNNSTIRQEIIKVITSEDENPISAFRHTDLDPVQRGVLRYQGEIFDLKAKKITGTRPIVLLLPGIMGSHLYVDNQKIWADGLQLIKGGFRKKLDLSNSKDKKVEARSISKESYQKIIDFFMLDYDVDVLAYDWRLDLSKSAKKLKNRLEKILPLGQPIKILAHSMGGLVVRQLILDFPNLWKLYSQKTGSRFVMLGTPWLGAHDILKVLIGRDSKLRHLGAHLPVLIAKNVKVVQKFPALYQLLPLTDEEHFEKQDYWEHLDTFGQGKIQIPGKKYLNAFSGYKKKILEYPFDFKNIYYIAGKANRTAFGYKSKNSLFRKTLEFSYTDKGDGRVTWDLGIPRLLPKHNLYYTTTEHHDLAGDPDLFQAIKDIFEHGTTHLLYKDPMQLAKFISRSIEDEFASNDPKEIERLLLNQKIRYPNTQPLSNFLNVSVVHGDLKMASYPLMLGHYESDAIVSAEAAINRYFNNQLSQRYDLRRYPNKICDNHILLNLENQPKGAIIIGLGEAPKLTAFRLSESIKAAVLEYVLFMKDNYSHIEDQSIRTSISTLFIGNTSNNISMENSISSILSGIALANKIIDEMDENIPTIKNIEFIENMDHIAEHGFENLALIERYSTRFKINLEKKIGRQSGRRKGSYFRQDNDLWYTIRTTKKIYNGDINKSNKLNFTQSSGKSRIEKESNSISDTIVNGLLEKLSLNNSWNINTSKTLFEMLIPNSFKDILRTQNNILWKMDRETAAIPWEMFHDMDTGTQRPTFVNAGLIRQYITKRYRIKPEIIRDSSALVIGNSYEKCTLETLPNVIEESKQIIRSLTAGGYDVNHELDGKWNTILEKVINKRYKILHISGHGKYDETNDEIGIALDDKIFLKPEFLKQKTVVPEFAFINCCYSGRIPSSNSKYSKNRNHFAANVGTELIEMGAEAVVVAGWAIYDSISSLFAQKLYKFMMEGYAFGTAVLKARKACYDFNPHANSWAAFQCYGNPWYKLVKKTPVSQSFNQYISKAKLIQDLENLLFATEGAYTENSSILDALKEIITSASESELYDSDAVELVARIYHAIGDEESAYETYDQLIHQEDASYSVKSIEQYCNLMVKVLVKRYKKDPNNVGTADIDKLKVELQMLSSLHPTSERNSILASGYKRLAILDSTNQKSHLSNMRAFYELAYRKARQGALLNSIYSLTNWGVGVALTMNKKESERTEYLSLLKSKQKEIKKQSMSAKTFWHKIAPANIALTLILFEEEKKNFNALKKTVLDIYKAQWQDAGNRGNLNAELEHIEFLLTFVMDNKQHNLLNKIKDELEDLGKY
ncbi:MAG: CHAT domain-containing protein [Bacteroidota bacterium]